MKPIFEPKKIIDPLTGKEKILTPKEQEELLEKGIFIDFTEDKKDKNGKSRK